MHTFGASAQYLGATFKYMGCPVELQSTSGHDHPGMLSKSFEEYRFRHNYNYYGNSNPSLLMAELKSSLERKLDHRKRPVLLLSDGKDSLLIALALAEMGVPCDTLTFLRRNDEELKEFIKATANTLGHNSYFVSIDEISERLTEGFFWSAISKMEQPVIDQAYLFFLSGIRQFIESQGDQIQLLDGMGNDEYFGGLPNHMEKNAYRASRFLRGNLRRGSAQPADWYFRTKVESLGVKSALSLYFPFKAAYPLHQLLDVASPNLGTLEYVDYRSFVRSKTVSRQAMMGKTLAVGKALNVPVVFPWDDAALSEFCFNLPVQEKFDAKKNVNKVAMRKVLHSKLGWMPKKRGVDLLLDIDVARFNRWDFIPKSLLSAVVPSKLVSEKVFNRATLELVNASGFCLSHGVSENEVLEIFVG